MMFDFCFVSAMSGFSFFGGATPVLSVRNGLHIRVQLSGRGLIAEVSVSIYSV